MSPALPSMQTVAYLLGPERLELRRVEVPRPGEGEILVRVGAATTCGTDVKVFRHGGHARMLRAPCPFGHELAGTVVACGEGAAGFAEGDSVVVVNSAACGACGYCLRGRENLCERLEYLNGAYAEHVLVPRRFVERSVYRVPDGLPLEIAALAEPLACVVHGVERCDLDEPASVVVYGAGAIGLLFTAVLAARGHFVVAADPNPPRLEVARRLGASRTLAIRRGGGEAGRAVAASPGGRGFEVAIDATGVREVWMDAIASVRPGGLVNLFGGCAPGTSVPLDTHAVHYSEITVRGVYHHRPAAVREALALLERGTFDARALLTSERPLEEVEEALRSMMRKVDLKVVIRPRGL